jgi:hypothetical protein
LSLLLFSFALFSFERVSHELVFIPIIKRGREDSELRVSVINLLVFNGEIIFTFRFVTCSLLVGSRHSVPAWAKPGSME